MNCVEVQRRKKSKNTKPNIELAFFVCTSCPTQEASGGTNRENGGDQERKLLLFVCILFYVEYVTVNAKFRCSNS
jgi:hypothetical protein